MSSVLKKIVKHVKKVFKKIVKVVKKILKSKIFKVIVAAVVIYFTAGAAAGWLGSAGAAGGAAGAGTAAATTAATTTAAAGTAATAATATTAAITTAVPTAVVGGGMTAGQGILASSVLSTGGNMLGAYAKGKEEEERLEVLKKNSETKLDIYGMYAENQKKAGAIATDAGGNTNYDSPVQQAANVEKPEQSFYNGANDSWSPVQRVAKVSNTNRTANDRDTESNV